MRAFIAVDAEGSAGPVGRLQHEIMSSGLLGPKDAKPVEPQNLHFTLVFLGELSEREAEAVKDKLSKIEFEPFQISYAGLGAFPRASSARVIWVGTSEEGGGRQKLVALAGQVAGRMAELGFKPDKPFSPHLTIFRIKRSPVRAEGLVARYGTAVFSSGLIDRVQLKKSDLLPSGPVYSNIYTVDARKK